MPVATNLDRIVTCLEQLLPIKLFKPLPTWFCKIPWQTKTTISPLLQSLWSPNLTGWWLTFKDSYHMTYHIIWLLSCLIISTPIISYDSYHMSHTTFNQVVLLNHLSIWNISISTVTRFIATKLGKVLTLGRRFSMQMLKSLTTSCFFFILPDGVSVMDWQKLFVCFSFIVTLGACD